MSKFISDIKRKQTIFVQDGAVISLLRTFITDGTSANLIYRCMRWCDQYKLLPIALFFQAVNKYLNGCLIGRKAEFGEGFVLMHPIGVVINSKVKGGRNITIESGVVIGDSKGKSPTLENNIFIGSGAKIFGEISISNGVTIGANAVVTKSAKENTTLLGVPAKPKI